MSTPHAPRRQIAAALLVCALGFAASSQAAIVNHADVNGLRTFEDTSTGRVWLDLDNFFDLTPNQMLSAANAAGFTLASRADVAAVVASMPLNAGQWGSYRPIIGDAPNRELYWGFYDDGGDPYGYAYAYDFMDAWSFLDDVAGGNFVQNGGGDFADMNIWAFRTGNGSNVPEPGSALLLALGASGLVAIRRRK